MDNLRSFIQDYKKTLIFSCLLHLFVFTFLGLGFFNFKKSSDIKVADHQPHQSVQAVTVDTTKVDKIIYNIKKKESKTAHSNKQARKALKNLQQAKKREEKKIKELKNKQAAMQKEKSLIIEKQKKELVDLKNKQILAKQKLNELKHKQDTATKSLETMNTKIVNAEKKKAKDLEKQQQLSKEKELIAGKTSIITRHQSLIKNQIIQKFSINNQYIQKNLRCKMKITTEKDGNVTEVLIVRSSGNLSFDRAARLAVKKASPLLVPQESEIFKSFAVFMINFDPKELVS